MMKYRLSNLAMASSLECLASILTLIHLPLEDESKAVQIRYKHVGLSFHSGIYSTSCIFDNDIYIYAIHNISFLTQQRV